MVSTDVRRLSVQDYHRMVEVGILEPDERVELIAGQLYQMAAKGTAHSAALTRIARVLSHSLGNRALLRFQDPVRLSDDSEPEPDLAVVTSDPRDYEDHHPTPDEIYFLIEISDRTLKRDRTLKAKIYAQSGITDYWIWDIPNNQLWVLREPSPSGYQQEMQLSSTDVISPLSFPDCVLSIASFLGA